MMKHQLLGCQAKTERARECINLLAPELRETLRTGGYERTRRFSEAGVASDIVTGPELPPRVPVLIGEVAHHLRSALDHLVWALVLENTGRPGTTSTGFPIYRQKPEGKALVQFRGKIKGVREDCARAIADLQPYNDPQPDGDFLWLVHELNRVDKHRLLISTVTRAHLYKGGQAERFLRTLPRPIGVPRADLAIGSTFAVEVTVGDLPFAPFPGAVPLLAVLTSYVEAVINRFEPTFAERN